MEGYHVSYPAVNIANEHLEAQWRCEELRVAISLFCPGDSALVRLSLLILQRTQFPLRHNPSPSPASILLFHSVAERVPSNSIKDKGLPIPSFLTGPKDTIEFLL